MSTPDLECPAIGLRHMRDTGEMIRSGSTVPPVFSSGNQILHECSFFQMEIGLQARPVINRPRAVQARVRTRFVRTSAA